MKRVMISSPDSDPSPYTMIEAIEDIGEVFCFGPDDDLRTCFEEGKTIIVNPAGGYCFFEEGYHTITG